MREIKFRGKRIWTDEWIYGNLVIDKHGRNHIVPFAYFDEDGHHLSYDDDTDTPVFIMQESVGQFTGLHDKNGKEIYECDILSQGEARFIVKWDDKHAMYKCFFEDLSDNYCNLDDSYIHEFFEVIGNIHEATK